MSKSVFLTLHRDHSIFFGPDFIQSPSLRPQVCFAGSPCALPVTGAGLQALDTVALFATQGGLHEWDGCFEYDAYYQAPQPAPFLTHFDIQTILLPKQCLRGGYSGATTALDIFWRPNGV